MRADTDLFGVALPLSGQLRKDGRLRKIGYAAKPGTGPKGKRCNTCVNYGQIKHADRITPKCQLMSAAWTHGPESDIHPNAPACAEWTRKPFIRTSAAVAA